MPTSLRENAEKFCKRRGNLLNKLSQLCGLTGARAAVIVLSITGRLYFSGGSSVEEMEETCFDYVRRNGRAMLPMRPKVKKQRQRPEIAKITDPVQLRRSFSNRLLTLIKMASKFCTDTKAPAAVVVFSDAGIKMTSGLRTFTDAGKAVVVFSDTGFLCRFGNDSFENIIIGWFKKQRESYVTEEYIDCWPARMARPSALGSP